MRRNRAEAFLNGYATAYNLGNSILRDFATDRAARISPVESSAYTPEQGDQLSAAADAKDAEGNPLYQVGHDGNNYTVTPTAGGETGTVPPEKQYRLGKTIQNRPFTDSEVYQGRLSGLSDVALQFGDVNQAAKLQGMSDKARNDSVQENVRNILSGGQSYGLSNASPRSYLDQVSPQVIDTYLKAGKIDEAKAFRDFSQSERGRSYGDRYSKAKMLIDSGDVESALPLMQSLYNDAYPDGQRAQLTHIGDGNYSIGVYDQATGKQLGTRTMSAKDIGNMAIGGLSPDKLIEFEVQQRGKRAHDAAMLDRQMQLEKLRQEGQETRDDRRDDRLDQKLDAQAEQLERRLSQPRSGLTLSQQRQNEEIDAARAAVAGLSPQEIMRRTAKTSNTGRENPDYDPALARQAALANRRKIGDDDQFAQQKEAPSLLGKPLPSIPDDQLEKLKKLASPTALSRIEAEQINRRFRGDDAMRGYSLGKKTTNGFEVFDGSGKLVGHYH